jgi:hypothetical protein
VAFGEQQPQHFEDIDSRQLRNDVADLTVWDDHTHRALRVRREFVNRAAFPMKLEPAEHRSLKRGLLHGGGLELTQVNIVDSRVDVRLRCTGTHRF